MGRNQHKKFRRKFKYRRLGSESRSEESKRVFIVVVIIVRDEEEGALLFLHACNTQVRKVVLVETWNAWVYITALSSLYTFLIILIWWWFDQFGSYY